MFFYTSIAPHNNYLMHWTFSMQTNEMQIVFYVDLKLGGVYTSEGTIQWNVCVCVCVCVVGGLTGTLDSKAICPCLKNQHHGFPGCDGACPGKETSLPQENPLLPSKEQDSTPKMESIWTQNQWHPCIKPHTILLKRSRAMPTLGLI
jgi:hypothetical protein